MLLFYLLSANQNNAHTSTHAHIHANEKIEAIESKVITLCDSLFIYSCVFIMRLEFFSFHPFVALLFLIFFCCLYWFVHHTRMTLNIVIWRIRPEFSIFIQIDLGDSYAIYRIVAYTLSHTCTTSHLENILFRKIWGISIWYSLIDFVPRLFCFFFVFRVSFYILTRTTSPMVENSTIYQHKIE